MKKLILISFALVLQACASSAPRENPFESFEVFNGECQVVQIDNKDFSDICAPRFVHAKSKSGLYMFVYYMLDKDSIIVSGTSESWQGDTISMPASTLTFLKSNKSVRASGKCSIEKQSDGRYASCDITANEKDIKLVFSITEQVK